MEHGRLERKRLGAYYTPRWLADELVRWALYSDTVQVLDPSFGGCAFLAAALSELQARCVRDPGRQIFGVDVDPVAFQHAQRLTAAGVPRKNLTRGSFLSGAVYQRLPRVDVVIGNPPYVRHHVLAENEITSAQREVERLGVDLPRMASAWAYFTIMASACISPGGRMAFILPGALLHANYSEVVIEWLKHSFSSLRLIHIHERLFAGTNEETIVVLGDGKSSDSTTAFEYARVANRAELASAVRTPNSAFATQYGEITPDAAAARERILRRVPHAPIGDLAQIRIGIVTGANDFFIRRASDPLLDHSGVTSIPIISHGGWLRAPYTTARHLSRISAAGHQTRLVLISRRARQSSLVRSILRRAERDGIHRRAHCQKRESWYTIEDTAAPDIFMSYRSGGTPRLAINSSDVTCTNSIHRLWCAPAYRADIVSGSLSSLFSLEAELHGRTYGGGVLKLEPSEVRRVLVPLVHVSHSELAAARTLGERQRIVDRILVRRYGIATRDLKAIRDEAELWASRRARHH